MGKQVYKIQRFMPGHKFYTNATIVHEGKEYGCVFGQCVKADGTFMHYTLERKDTLIEEGIYTYDFFYSNANKATVPRLRIHNGVDIGKRVLEHHIANFPYELKGCCAHGKDILLTQCMLTKSGIAWHELIEDMKGQEGIFIYESFKEVIA